MKEEKDLVEEIFNEKLKMPHHDYSSEKDGDVEDKETNSSQSFSPFLSSLPRELKLKLIQELAMSL